MTETVFHGVMSRHRSTTYKTILWCDLPDLSSRARKGRSFASTIGQQKLDDGAMTTLACHAQWSAPFARGLALIPADPHAHIHISASRDKQLYNTYLSFSARLNQSVLISRNDTVNSSTAIEQQLNDCYVSLTS